MVVWFPQAIRYGLSIGAVEIVCPGCRELVVADVHEKIKGSGKVGRCRLCGFFAALPDSIAPVVIDGHQFLSPNSHASSVAPFVVVIGSPHEAARVCGAFEFTRELALLGAIAIALKWHRQRVFWSRTIFAILLACAIGFVLVAVAIELGFAWLAYPSTAGSVLGVLLLHRRLISVRTREDMRAHVDHFTSHFKVSKQDLINAGIREGGDFKMAARWLQRNFPYVTS